MWKISLKTLNSTYTIVKMSADVAASVFNKSTFSSLIMKNALENKLET